MAQQLLIVVLVAAAYTAFGALSSLVAYAPTDAWTVWLASGVVLGLLLSLRRARWAAVLGGGFVGATAFAFNLGSAALEAVGYGAIEVLASGAAALLVSRLAALPLRFHAVRDLGALILAGAVPLALVGAVLAAAWQLAAGGTGFGTTLRVWFISNFIGTLLVAPVIISWAQFRVRRSGGMTMPAFTSGAVACALFLGTLWLLFSGSVAQRFGGSVGAALTYLPIVFMSLVAVLWGARGATLAGFVGALIAMVCTAQGNGPFAGVEGFLGEAQLEVEAYALAIALLGLLIAVLGAAQRQAAHVAREWQTRFEAAIGAHRLLAYEWDPASDRMLVTGDTLQLLGVAPERIAMLADWLALVAAVERDGVAARFDERVRGRGEADTLRYALRGSAGATQAATDEARAIRDHDGALHRIVGIVRVTAGPVESSA
ncbi:MAG: MASE1 domain-containing protein [Burkholderiales bacterium]|nr:MASE1 domain-containing protein [Burkholderiales bacterium]